MDKWKLKTALSSRELNVKDFLEALNKNGLNLSTSSFYKRLRGEVEFNLNEIKTIVRVLNLTNAEMESIFFTEKVS